MGWNHQLEEAFPKTASHFSWFQDLFFSFFSCLPPRFETIFFPGSTCQTWGPHESLQLFSSVAFWRHQVEDVPLSTTKSWGWTRNVTPKTSSRPLTISQQWLNFNFNLRTCGLVNFKTENIGNWNQTNKEPCFNDISTENGYVLHHSSRATPCGPWFRLTSKTSAHRMSAPVRGCWRPSQHRLRKKEDRMEVQGIVIRDTVDGRNPANQLRLVVYRLSHLQGCYTSQVVQEFFHQQ